MLLLYLVRQAVAKLSRLDSTPVSPYRPIPWHRNVARSPWFLSLTCGEIAMVFVTDLWRDRHGFCHWPVARLPWFSTLSCGEITMVFVTDLWRDCHGFRHWPVARSPWFSSLTCGEIAMVFVTDLWRNHHVFLHWATQWVGLWPLHLLLSH